VLPPVPAAERAFGGNRSAGRTKIGAHVSFVTAPIDGFKTISGQSVILLDQNEVPRFFSALGKDRLASYLAGTPSPRYRPGRASSP